MKFHYRLGHHKYVEEGELLNYFTFNKVDYVTMLVSRHRKMIVRAENVTGLVPPNYSLEEWL